MGANKRYIDNIFRTSRLCSSRTTGRHPRRSKPSSSERCSRRRGGIKSARNAGSVHPRPGWNARGAAAPAEVSGCLLVALGVLIGHIRLRRGQMCDRGACKRADQGAYVKRRNTRKMESARSTQNNNNYQCYVDSHVHLHSASTSTRYWIRPLTISGAPAASATAGNPWDASHSRKRLATTSTPRSTR